MAKGLKSAGRNEVDAVKRRVMRQLALGRISREDHDYIVQRIDEVDARIISMRETGEEEDPWR